MPVAPRKIPPPSDDKRWRLVDATMRRYSYAPNALIETLHTTQETFGYLQPEALNWVARMLRLPYSRVLGVATFYSYFLFKPKGEHTCVICMGTACYIKGAGDILAALEQSLNIKSGETTPDGKVSLTAARCIGACGLAAAAIYDGQVVGKISADQAVKHVQGWRPI